MNKIAPGLRMQLQRPLVSRGSFIILQWSRSVFFTLLNVSGTYSVGLVTEQQSDVV